MKPNHLQNIDQLCQFFKIIGNRNRMNIMMLLVNGERSVGEVELILEIKQPNLSHELKKLRELGLAVTRRDAKVIYYSLASDEVTNLMRGIVWLTSADSRGGEIEIETGFPAKQASGFASVSNSSHTVLGTSHASECGDFPVIRHQ